MNSSSYVGGMCHGDKCAANSKSEVMMSDFAFPSMAKDWNTGMPLSDAELIAPKTVLHHHALTSSGRTKQIEFLGERQIWSRQQLNNLHGMDTVLHLRLC